MKGIVLVDPSAISTVDMWVPRIATITQVYRVFTYTGIPLLLHQLGWANLCPYNLAEDQLKKEFAPYECQLSLTHQYADAMHNEVVQSRDSSFFSEALVSPGPAYSNPCVLIHAGRAETGLDVSLKWAFAEDHKKLEQGGEVGLAAGCTLRNFTKNTHMDILGEGESIAEIIRSLLLSQH